MMRRTIHLFVVSVSVLVVAIVSSCGNSTSDIVSLVSERDSLRAQNAMIQQRLSRIDTVMQALNETVNAIAAEEHILFGNLGSDLSRDDVLRNVENYEQLIQHQHERIADLERQLAGMNPMDGDNSGTLAMINMLKAQLAQKDQQIAYLKSELAKKDVDIARLRTRVAEQNTMIADQNSRIESLDRRSRAQSAALESQSEYINTCYVLIGSKKDLERKGVIKKGRLVAEASLDKSKFAKVDIRTWREISFSAKRPRFITAVPESSYTLTTDGNNNYTLTITNPTAFWNISNFLVIQTN